jgi:hypothetical protein
MNQRPGTYRDADKSPVPMADAKAAWAAVARDALERVATEYHGLINYGDLAEELQDRSGIRTRMLMHYWIGDVLGRVSRECHKSGKPMLPALCVHQDGTIGDGYAAALAENYGGSAPRDLDMHAAEERLKCYRHFGAKIPVGGGCTGAYPAGRLASSRSDSASEGRLSKASLPHLPSSTARYRSVRLLFVTRLGRAVEPAGAQSLDEQVAASEFGSLKGGSGSS